MRVLRARFGWTQDHVAKRLGVHESAVSRWESGNRQPGMMDLLRLADLFSISIDELLGRTEQFTPAGSAVVDHALLQQLEAVETTAEFDQILSSLQGQMIWLPVPDGAVVMPLADAVRRAQRLAQKHSRSRFAGLLFRSGPVAD